MAGAIPTRLTAAEGRKFAFPVAIAFLALGALLWWWRGHVYVPTAFAIIGGLLLCAGLIVPAHLGPVYRAWMGLALAISKVTTPILMGITFYGVVTPIALVMRLSGRRLMEHAETDRGFWIARDDGGKRTDLERQF